MTYAFNSARMKNLFIILVSILLGKFFFYIFKIQFDIVNFMFYFKSTFDITKPV